ncbi:hypothetical protein Tco_0754802 [Tanacetum coccineum]
MGTKVTSSSGSVLEEPEIQKLQMQAKIFKENSLNKLNALKSTTQLLERQSIFVYINKLLPQLFGNIHEVDSKSLLSVIKVQFERKKSSEHENAIEQCIIERASQCARAYDDAFLKKVERKTLQINCARFQEVSIIGFTSSGDGNKQVLTAESVLLIRLEQVQNHDESKAPFLNVQMTFEQRSSSLVLHQITSDHNRSELGIQGPSNETVKFKAGFQKVFLMQTDCTHHRQELELLFHSSSCNAEGNRFDWDECIGIIDKIELTLEQSQQGVSNDVLVSIEGIEE